MFLQAVSQYLSKKNSWNLSWTPDHHAPRNFYYGILFLKLNKNKVEKLDPLVQIFSAMLLFSRLVSFPIIENNFIKLLTSCNAKIKNYFGKDLGTAVTQLTNFIFT